MKKNFAALLKVTTRFSTTPLGRYLAVLVVLSMLHSLDLPPEVIEWARKSAPALLA